ncbi:diacylglycerol kinase [Wenyingzhuangia sp. IMCC45574]
MKEQRKNFLIDRIYSLGYAFKGLWHLLKTENAVKVHVTSTIILTITGFLFDLNNYEWMFQFLSLGLVMGVEALNSSIEKIADFVQPNFDTKIGTIKDVSAGAVLFAAMYGGIVLGIIYIPKILQLINQ